MKFVGTLDGKTCPYCASYDGYIWRGEEIAEARRPPIHPNCRCCLIPYVELKDEEGNVVDVDGERPAANADFDKLAQDAYNERAREKGWKRRWDDLSPSTRLKYYYQAQKDFEAETGKPAYRQVSGATTFQEFFHRQPDSFKRAWLGAKRYELYKDGKLKEKNIFKPDLTYQVSVESLVRDGFRSVSQIEKEEPINDLPVLKGPYEHIEPEFDHSNDVRELRRRWENLSLDELSAVKERIDRSMLEWHLKIESNKPKREEYKELWEQDYKEGFDFWEDLIFAFNDFQIDARYRQEIIDFNNPFNSIMQPEDYRNNSKTKDRLARIEEIFKKDIQRLGEKDALQRKREALRELLLPKEPPKAILKAIIQKLPKKGFRKGINTFFPASEFQGDKEVFIEEVREGLRLTARLLTNLGIGHKKFEDLRIEPEVLDRPECFGKSIRLGYRPGENIKQYVISDCAHEFGHGVENSLSDTKQRINDFYEHHSRKDIDGNYIKREIYQGEMTRELDFETPDPYIRKEYIDPLTGKLTGTELTSMFFQYIIDKPELFFDSRYKTYFTNMIQLWKRVN